jgi:hypothetical protein
MPMVSPIHQASQSAATVSRCSMPSSSMPEIDTVLDTTVALAASRMKRTTSRPGRWPGRYSGGTGCCHPGLQRGADGRRAGAEQGQAVMPLALRRIDRG